jgi:hypothetical protein
MSIFKSEMHRPSLVKLWQIPPATAFPGEPDLPCLEFPDDEHETSYLAESASTLIFSLVSMKSPLHHLFHDPIIAHMFDTRKGYEKPLPNK